MPKFRVYWTEQNMAIVEAEDEDTAIEVAMELGRLEIEYLGLVDVEVEELEEAFDFIREEKELEK